MLALLLVLLSPLPSSANPADACNSAIKAYRDHLGSLPKNCQTEQDCVVTYAGIQYCNAPVILAKSVDVNKDAKAKKLSEAMGKACQAIWAVAGACPKREVSATCRAGVCADGTGALHRE